MSFLNDCASKGVSIAELFLVEDGICEKAKRGRNRMTQAVMDIDASIRKIASSEIPDILGDENLTSLIAALGIGINLMPGVEMLSMERLRYGKVIIVTEPTEAGKHIQEQLIAFVNQYMNSLVSNGHLFVVPTEKWSQLSDGEFQSDVMLPESRHIVQVKNDGTLS